MNDQTSGFVANPEALNHYINQIVNPALENFDAIASKLYVTTGVSHQMILGESRLQLSTEFNDSCKRMLNVFFQTHHAMTELQRDLVHAVTQFRDILQQSAAAYFRNEVESAQFLGRLSARLDGEEASGGASR